MTTKQATQHNARLWGISLGLLLVAVGIAAYALMATPLVSTPATGQAGSTYLPPLLRSLMHTLRAHSVVRFVWPEPAALDPAQQGVMEYLRVHSIVRPASAQTAAHDPAAASVLNYVQAHERAQPALAVDPAAQGVLNYIRAHEVARPSQIVPLDPNARSVFDYLRAHGQWPQP